MLSCRLLLRITFAWVGKAYGVKQSERTSTFTNTTGMTTIGSSRPTMTRNCTIQFIHEKYLKLTLYSIRKETVENAKFESKLDCSEHKLNKHHQPSEIVPKNQ